ncbi:flagellar basal-body MS-ring/collar protein FliF [Glaciimonas sp. Gout2]|uniref:flagellar basal-body MS-ring/collar protein FliF n=2 Tax=Glaciimonas TaxID=1229970 RepID=UPI002B22A89D|nr:MULTISPECIES: flagellar basal-body MS-ring/collar protein FliF [unclassified Glaciimonas]MEB0010208.1 flagellar basal-body MS-ring/collar protein FliF [Glaciimonas sp. Cout2]MEB0083707.1 flagellar basal-body MS-ring/collar protein FliF [Glaciimonas sp. Gout2]
MSVASTGAKENAADTNKFSLLEQLRANPKLPIIIGGAAVIAAIVALWLWTRAPDYRVLFSNLSDRDGGAIIASLQQMNIPYKFADGGGAVLVASDQVYDARLKLASQGLPKGGSVGFELMDNQKFGVSQFAEQVNYQRALEGEIAHSIESISSVATARIHLAIPKPSLFVRDQQKPSAAVILTLHRGRAIDEGQVSAIAHLISSSVPDLNANNVTVVDQAGNLLSVPSAGNRGLDASQLKFSQEIEQSYIRRIEAILQPIVGSGNVKAQVVADIDFATVENTDEKYRPNQDPEKAAIRSQQSSDSNQQGATPAGGVPGALSNQPPLNPTAPIVTAAANRPLPGATAAAGGQSTTQASANPIGAANRPASTGGSSNVRRDVTTNYEVDRSIRHVQQSAGGIKRLSVAVVVNYRGIRNAQGKIAAQAIPPAELEQVRNLVREAMGFNTERGDSLNVVNSQFVSSEIVEPVLPWWQQPENIALGKTLGQYLLIAVLGLWLWFGVLRPLLRKYLAPPLEVPQALPINAEPAEDIPAETVSLSAEAQVRANMRHQENLTHAKALSEKDPKLVAMVIKNWMDSGKNANG